jgi:hypothetical protein
MLPPDIRNPFNAPDFRAELAQVFDEKLKPVTDLLKKHQEKIDKHEAALNRAKGARWAFGVGWVFLTAVWEWFMHGTTVHKP